MIKDVEQMDLTGYTEESAGKVESALEFAKKLHLMRMRQVLM